MTLIGFAGSRSLAPRWRPLVTRVVRSTVRAGRGTAVGDASGADLFVRSCAPAPLVFRPDPEIPFPGALAARSAAMVRAVAASGAGAGLAVFVSLPCPPRLAPSPSPGRCFCGAGSGSWASAAFAAGLGLPVVLFWCAPGPARLPSWWAGSWPRAGSGAWASGRLFAPASFTMFTRKPG